MTGYPSGPLDARLELQLGGAWTDITDYTTPDGAQEAVITCARADGAQQASPASLPVTLDNTDARFSIRNAMSPYYGMLRLNTPARYSVASPYGNYLRLEDPDGTAYAQCPDSAAFTATSALDIRLDLDLDDWGQQTTLVTKWASGTDKAWAVWLSTGGQLVFEWYDGTANRLDTCPLPLPPGRRTIRVTWAGSGGSHTVTWQHGPSLSGPWTVLGTVTSAGTAVPAHSTAPLVIGYGTGYISADTGHAGQNIDGIRGSAYGVQLYVDGTLKAAPDFTAQAAGTASFADAQANTWSLFNGAEISDRDYRLHGEISSLVPSVTSAKTARASAVVSGLLNRLQQGDAPPVDSPMKRALLSRPDPLVPLAYWPCEDAQGPFSSAVGGQRMRVTTGSPQYASDSSFAASAPLPQFNGSSWYGQIPKPEVLPTAIVFRFLFKLGTSGIPPTTAHIAHIYTTGTCAIFAVRYYSGNGVGIGGQRQDGTFLFDSGGFSLGTGPQLTDTLWLSLELTQSGGTISANLIYLGPGQPTAYQITPQTFTGTLGYPTAVRFNPSPSALTDTVCGHASVQGAWETMYNLQRPLDAWNGELAANRFTRIAGEQGLRSRIYGAPDRTQAMGPQTVSTAWDLLQECENAGQGLICEPRGAVAIGYRTLASMCNQDPVATLDYGAADLPGGAQAAEDAQNLVNDWTVTRPDGSSARAVLDDGSAKSISAPEDGGAGRYQSTAQANLASSGGQLLDAAGWRLGQSTADEARYRQIGADFGTPGAPAADLARLRAGDVLELASPPGTLQTGSIRQIVTGATETLGPGRVPVFDCVPASPFDAAVFDDPVLGRADTDGSQLNSPVTAAATTLSVATTGPSGILWTTAAADLPFDIGIEGEQVTVTAVSGASSPQAFTVTRSVNGVVKSHPAGAGVRLWRTPRWGLA